MNTGPIARKMRLIVFYILPTIAGVLWTRMVFEEGYSSGWAAFQNPASSSANADPTSLVAINLFVAASFVLVAIGKVRLGNLAAFILVILAGTWWIGTHA